MIIQLVPGDPARVVLGVAASEENVEALRERLGLNEPVWQQYATWLAGLLQGDMGNSLVTGQPVTDQILQRLPATLTLAAAGLLVGLLIGLPAGILSAFGRTAGKMPVLLKNNIYRRPLQVATGT